MTYYVYIHGFNSGAASRSGARLANMLKESVFCPEYDASLPWENCMLDLERQIKAACGSGQLIMMGSSLGGFYASQMRLDGIAKVIMWNPVIYPAIQLERFLGHNVRFTDGLEWDFGRHALLSYAQSPDPRQWHNFYWERLEERQEDEPARVVFLGIHDELLDSSLAMSFWSGHSDTRIISAGHSIEDFSHALEIIKSCDVD